MYNELKNLQKLCDKGENIKILTDTDYKTFIGKNDLMDLVGTNLVRIVRNNGAIVTINTDHIVVACINKRF